MARANRVKEILELTRVRILLFWREPEAVFWVFVFPVVLTVVLGFAFRTQKPEPSRIGVMQNVAGMTEVVKRLKNVEHVEVVAFEELAAARRQLRKGAINALVVTTKPTLRFDPNRPEAMLARLRVQMALGSDVATIKAAVSEQPVSERGSRYIDFLFAGILGMNLMGTGIWGVGFALADMRQKKLLKRLIVTPLRRSSLLLSFMLSRIAFLACELVVLLGFGLFVLDVPMSGSYLSLIGLALLGSLAFSGLGLLLASRARTIEGVSGLMNFAMMPMWLASGVFFSYERFPEFLHDAIRLLPLTALNDALRTVMLDGGGLAQTLPQLGVLGGWAVLCFGLALKLFRWQ